MNHRRDRHGARIAPGLCYVLFACLSVYAALLTPAARAQPPRQVVLYTSCDDYLLREVTPIFEKQTGIHVLIVGDTEATKTTRLVQRVIDEKERPRADVWWSNEPFGSVRLAREGLLEPYTSSAEQAFKDGWPAAFRAKDQTWYGFALRSRAIVYNSKKLTQDKVPTSVRDLAKPEWKNRIGMARPQFGTTRGQMGALFNDMGESGFREFLKGLKANGVRLYDGNSAVVRGAANGEIEIGLTDTDDVYDGQHEGWPVAMTLEQPAAEQRDGHRVQVGAPLLIANTVGKIKGAPHSAEAGALIDFLLSEQAERVLVDSDAKLSPIHPDLAKAFPTQRLPMTVLPDCSAIEKAVPGAMKVWDEVFGR